MDGSEFAGDVTNLDEVLAHYGVKGMRWGVRRGSSGSISHPASEDAQAASAAKSKVKAGGTKALSNQELQALVQRMNLEQQLSRLQPPTGKQAATKFISDTLVSVGKQEATKLAAGFAAKQIAGLIKK